MNRLGAERSPYLLQHKDNPVWWQPWGDDAFEQARREQKPIFLSIGYSSCYWCHVMEKDSFEDHRVAELLNKSFISIKVDREERPDLDHVYMDAVVGLTGHGGWPMSVFLTPDRKPFWGGTFFPQSQFLNILRALKRAWERERTKIDRAASELTEQLAGGPTESSAHLPESIFHTTYRQLAHSFDPEDGGFGPAPKFPPCAQLRFLLRDLRHLDEEGKTAAMEMVSQTLERMARSGLFDQLAGGFHRYSTDSKWLVPHFEKMLYDNALLAVVYAEGWQLLKDSLSLGVVRETLDYMLSELQSPEGAFFSAEDAGDVSEEGSYYIWRHDDLAGELPPEELNLACAIYGITPAGNFEQGNNILTYPERYPWEERSRSKTIELRRKLMALRMKRKHPFKDTKVLTDWNGLAISAFAKGHQVTGDKRYLEAAGRAASFLLERAQHPGGLYHRFAGGEGRFNACIDDYAFLIQGLLDLYEADFDLTRVERARDLQLAQDRHLWDEAGGGYFFSDSDDLILKKKEWFDGATPSGNSVSALNLLRLDSFFPEHGFRNQASALFAAAAPLIERYPSGFCLMLCAFDYASDRAREVVIAADSRVEAGPILEKIYRTFFPNRVLALSSPQTVGKLRLFQSRTKLNGAPSIYWCENKTCELPFDDPARLEEKLGLL